MATTLEIRAAGAADLDALRVLYRQLNPGDAAVGTEEGAEALRQLARLDGSAVFLGEVAGLPVATCTLVVIPNLTRGGAPYALIENVVTDQAHRRRGYAKVLLDAVVAEAWRQGCYKAMLLTGSEDPGVLGFYEAIGFEQTKTGFQVRRGTF